MDSMQVNVVCIQVQNQLFTLLYFGETIKPNPLLILQSNINIFETQSEDLINQNISLQETCWALRLLKIHFPNFPSTFSVKKKLFLSSHTHFCTFATIFVNFLTQTHYSILQSFIKCKFTMCTCFTQDACIHSL